MHARINLIQMSFFFFKQCVVIILAAMTGKLFNISLELKLSLRSVMKLKIIIIRMLLLSRGRPGVILSFYFIPAVMSWKTISTQADRTIYHRQANY